MIIPIRCFTCGKVIANLWKVYTETKERFESSTQDVVTRELEKRLNLKRFCCKTMLVCHVEIIDELLEYNKKNQSLNYTNPDSISIVRSGLFIYDVDNKS